jgi:DNA end-binding protein Ku
MPRALWSGTIGFGLVSVPVNLLTATKNLDVRFHQLEEETGARIRYRRVSEASGEEVPSERIVKGFELTPGQYVVVGETEMQALAPKASRTIDILGFVELDQIDPIYFEQPYYLAPEGSTTKPYQLLVTVMTELRKVAIGRIVLRSKEHLVAIRPVDGVLCLETMRHADEVLAPAGVVGDLEAAEPTARELEMAKQLVEALAEEFAPEQYHDEYREQLLELIEAKAAGQEIVARPVAEDQGKVLDLMAALEASLARSTTSETGSDEAGTAENEAPRKRARRSRQSA